MTPASNSGGSRRSVPPPWCRRQSSRGSRAWNAWPGIRANLPFPEKMFLGELAISPDGTRLAFTASKAGGQPALWIRNLDGSTAQPVAGAENAFFPFWSPDSRFVGFFANRKLKRVDPSGGTILTICDADRGVGRTCHPIAPIV